MNTALKICNNLILKGFLGKGKQYVVIFVPQIQLAPYVAASLRKVRSCFSGSYLIIYPESNKMSKVCLEYSKDCFGIHLKDFHNEEIFPELLKQISDRGGQLEGAVLHMFAGGLNNQIITCLRNREQELKWFFYSDGSRNNKECEFDSLEKSKLVNKVIKEAPNVTIINYGFDAESASQIEKVANVKNININYNLLDLVYSCCDFELKYINDLNVSSRRGVLAKNSHLILSRYWGREPYYFESEEAMYGSLYKSIEKSNLETKDIIYRGDNRANFDLNYLFDKFKCNKSSVQIKNIDDLLQLQKIPLREVLFENLLYLDEHFLRKINSFYSFDSSFPLIFMSKNLKKMLSDDVRIVVGFDFESVYESGIKSCFEVMKKRTLTVVLDILVNGVFFVHDSIGNVDLLRKKSGDSYEFLSQRFSKNGGFFVLTKTRNQ